MQTYTHTHTYIYLHTQKEIVPCITALTEVLTTITNKWKAQKLKFSLLKKPPNQKHDCHPTTTILTITFCAWEQYCQSVYRPPLRRSSRNRERFTKRALRVLETEGEFSDVSTCLVYPIWPRISWEGHPRAAHAQSDGCSHPIVLPQRHHPTFSSFNTPPRSMGRSTEDSNSQIQPQSLGPKQKRGTPEFKSYHKGTEIGECYIPERNKRAPERPPALGGEVDVSVEGMHPPKLHDRTTQHLKLPSRASAQNHLAYAHTCISCNSVLPVKALPNI